MRLTIIGSGDAFGSGAAGSTPDALGQVKLAWIKEKIVYVESTTRVQQLAFRCLTTWLWSARVCGLTSTGGSVIGPSTMATGKPAD